MERINEGALLSQGGPFPGTMGIRISMGVHVNTVYSRWNLHPCRSPRLCAVSTKGIMGIIITMGGMVIQGCGAGMCVILVVMCWWWCYG